LVYLIDGQELEAKLKQLENRVSAPEYRTKVDTAVQQKNAELAAQTRSELAGVLESLAMLKNVKL
jgi:hypothetical protein